MPPSKHVGMALSQVESGRYEVTQAEFFEQFQTIPELRAYLEYCNMFTLLIERVVAEVQATGTCTLKYKGIIIRDAEWRNPVASINWASCKLPTYLKLAVIPLPN